MLARLRARGSLAGPPWAAAQRRGNGARRIAVPAVEPEQVRHEEGDTLRLEISNPGALLNAIASNYRSLGRVLMEYVDNAIDASSELRLSHASEAGVCARVSVDIDADRRVIWIRDNCAGMGEDGLARIVAGVGESRKRGASWANGQFGFGVHAFRAAAGRLSVYSMQEDAAGSATVLHLSRSDSRVPRPVRQALSQVLSGDELVRRAMSEGVFASTNGQLLPRVPEKEENAKTGAEGLLRGTAVALRDVDPLWFEAARASLVSREIESHFESLLRDPSRLHVSVSEVHGGSSDAGAGAPGAAAEAAAGAAGRARRRARRTDLLCAPFDYDALPGKHFKETIPLLDPPAPGPLDKAAAATTQEGVGIGAAGGADRPGDQPNSKPALAHPMAAASAASAAARPPQLLGQLRVHVVVQSRLSSSPRPVRFFAKGRSIAAASHLQSFMEASQYKAALWEHPAVTGLVEVEGLEPVLTRDEFKRSRARLLAYECLRPLEEELMRELGAAMSAMADESMLDIEDLLSDSMQQLADESRPASEPQEQDQEDEQEQEPEPVAVAAPPGPVTDDGGIEYEPLVRADGAEAEERRRARAARARARRAKRLRDSGGLDVRLVRSPAGDEAAKRSFRVDRTVYVNVEHPQFRSRLRRDRAGKLTMGPRLEAYLANELALYFCEAQDGRPQPGALPAPLRDPHTLYEGLLDSAVQLEQKLYQRKLAVKLNSTALGRIDASASKRVSE
jgi:hypothetical protein